MNPIDPDIAPPLTKPDADTELASTDIGDLHAYRAAETDRSRNALDDLYALERSMGLDDFEPLDTEEAAG